MGVRCIPHLGRILLLVVIETSFVNTIVCMDLSILDHPAHAQVHMSRGAALWASGSSDPFQVVR